MKAENKIERLAVKLLIGALIVAVGLGILDKIGIQKAVRGIPPPTQTDAGGFTVMDVDDYQMVIDFKYAYDIEGLVVHTKDYFWGGVGDKLSPKDLALTWGKMAEYNTTYNFHWSQYNRRVTYMYGSEVDTELLGGEGGMNICVSNNHIIPADDITRWKLKMIRTGDHVRLKGYLVDVTGFNSKRDYFEWHSSTTRLDTGDGACEVIYVTDIEWL